MESLVSTAWLAGELGAIDLRVVDATWFAPADGRGARAEFEAAHIPGAVFFDIEEIADTGAGLPHMLPTQEKFASRAQSLGIGDGNRIVVYDNSPYRSAARVWWMFKLFGVHQVAVLDGGFQKWRAEDRATESGKPAIRHRHFSVWQDKTLVRDLAAVRANLTSKTEQVLDARSAGRFQGKEPEPRPGLRPGHIPGAKNLPYGNLFNEDGTYKLGQSLKAEYEAAGIDLAKPVITTCGSGITACTLLFGLHLLGKKDASVYDGSWAQWGGLPDVPVVTGSL
jgi:thiosulfate/3-mercaptopyruvate sulfurtransferase